MNFFSNIALNMHATGPAAVMCTWVIAVTALGLFGQGELARSAMTVLTVVGGMIFASFGFQKGAS